MTLTLLDLKLISQVSTQPWKTTMTTISETISNQTITIHLKSHMKATMALMKTKRMTNPTFQFLSHQKEIKKVLWRKKKIKKMVMTISNQKKIVTSSQLTFKIEQMPITLAQELHFTGK